MNPTYNQPRPRPINVPQWIPPSLITVTITGPQGKLRRLGDTDPAILAPLIEKVGDQMRATQGTPEIQHFRVVYKIFLQRLMVMGGRLTWWEDFHDRIPEMEYVCDAKLGTPTERDCTKLRWQSLGPPSDTVIIRPTTPRILTSSKCSERSPFPLCCEHF